MADQEWKTSGLTKYVVLKPCPACGRGIEWNCVCSWPCKECGGIGAVKPEDETAAYFVLRIAYTTDVPCDPHAREALRRYAESVAEDNPHFAADIRGWLDETA